MITAMFCGSMANNRKSFLEQKDMHNEMKKEHIRNHKMCKAGYETVISLKAKDKLGLNTSVKE